MPALPRAMAEDMALDKLDAYLCDLKEMQIRDGLHIFGVAPEGRLLTDLVVALARVPRGEGEGGDASLQRAIAGDLKLQRKTSPPLPTRGRELPLHSASALAVEPVPLVVAPLVGEMAAGHRGTWFHFDPLDCVMSDPWTGPKPAILADLTDSPGAPMATRSSASNCSPPSSSPANDLPRKLAANPSRAG